MDEVDPVLITRAKELLRTVRHTALATVNADSTPHLSPVFAGYGNDLTIYWSSAPAAQHSQNIHRTGRVFAVLFESTGGGGGLYLQATARQVTDTELPTALGVFNSARERFLREHVPPDHFMGASPQRLYKATVQRAWVNQSQKDQAGFVVRDNRYEISLSDLRQAV